LVKNPNFLILDEPTNDLDLITLHTLEDFLLNFQGCVIIVSHDRYFMDKLVDHIFVFEGEGKIRDFNGIYSEYRLDLDDRKKLKKQIEKGIVEDPNAKKEETLKAEEPKVKLSFNEKKEFEGLEGQIFLLEEKKTEIEAKLAEGGDNQAIMELSNELSEVLAALSTKEARWLALADRI